MVGVGGWWILTLLRLYTHWQVKFQKCVNDCFDVWSSFLYIPPSYQYIQDIECIVYCLEHDYLYLELASCFCSLRSKLGHQYSILKKVKCNKYICMYAHTHHMWVDRHRVKCALDASSRLSLYGRVASRIFVSTLSSQSYRLTIGSRVR